jgi:polyisoprenoid-binding protein YceI
MTAATFNRTIALCVVVLAAFAAPSAAANKVKHAPPPAAPVPAGIYTLDKAHTSLVFRVDHMGFSHFTARFTRLDGQLQFDPAKPETSAVNVTIDPRSLELGDPPAGFNDTLLGKQWLDVAAFPQITFRSTKVERTGRNAARITGELALHGVTQTVTLLATYNGGYAGQTLDPHARIGFSAHGVLKRSLFGIAYGVPPPGSKMGVSDEVEVIVESEFNGPPLAK